MKKTHLYQSALLFRKATWLFVFISLLSLNYFPAANFFTDFYKSVLLTSAESQMDLSKQADKNESVPYSNSGEEKSESDSQQKDLQPTIYYKSRRFVTDKTKLVFNNLSHVPIKRVPEKEAFPSYLSNLSNTCFASLYRFSIF